MKRWDELSTSDVIIVDADPLARSALRRLLEPAVRDVFEADNAAHALRRIEESTPAVAFCELRLPDMNGLRLAEQIRLVSPATAVVLLTSDVDIPAFNSLRRGIVGYLLKPLRREQLLWAADQGARWSEFERRTSPALRDCGVQNVVMGMPDLHSGHVSAE